MHECTFDHNTFIEAFEADLERARVSVLVQSPYISSRGVARMATQFSSLANRGVQVCLFAKQPIGWRNREDLTTSSEEIALEEFEMAVRALESINVHVNVRSRIHEKVVVIDFGIIYDGSMNVMSFNPRFTSERMTRIVNARKAICTIGLLSLDACSGCNRPIEADQERLIVNKSNLGKTISMLRTSRGLLQNTLATSLGTTRENINRIERGKYFPASDDLIDIIELLGCNIVVVSSHSVPFVAEVVRLLPPSETLSQPRGGKHSPPTFAPEAGKAPPLDTPHSAQVHTSR